ncbi:decaprenyl-phosphate phosphoribosyltransferase [Candidatus Microgenomates bacterium]|nr:decaprenyl-phosphate phosphoribosyltransferase [Candidatus Microgenomates bacterium]
MVKLLGYLFKASRPKQWLKNLSLFAAIVFTGQLFTPELLKISLFAFVIFCLLSSSSYLINDVIDANRDRLHPFKKLRPIASGKLSRNFALGVALAEVIFALNFSLLISQGFFLIALTFWMLHMSYSFFLKKATVIDILAIATCYILRVYAGEIATGFHLSVWLMLCIISLSLFLAIGKRRSELTLLTAHNESISAKVRGTLLHYSEKLLDVYTAIFANAIWITYAFFTFLERPPTYGWLWQSQWGQFLYSSYADRKWLMATIPLVIYGIMRYLQLIYEKSEGESPEEVLLSDKPLLFTVIFWSFAVVIIIYGLG